MARFFQPKKKSQIEKKHQQVKIERLDHHGAGIGYLNKKPVFVEGALPGEEVLVQLTESKSKYARGNLIKLLSESSKRVEPFCPHYKECGGCNMQHLSHEDQIEYKCQSLKQLFAKFAKEDIKLEAPVTGDEKGYRRRARFSLLVDKRSGELRFGFRKKQSKQVVNVTDCPVLDPALNSLLPELKACLSKLKASANLGHAEVVLGDDTPVVLLRYVRALPQEDRDKLVEFAQQVNVSLYLQSDKELELVTGDMPAYSEAGVRIPFLPTNFIQVNRKVNQKMVAKALDWLDIQEDESILDLFCGLGNFSLPAAQKARKVVGIEGVDEMVVQAKQNAEINRVTNAEFYQANLEEDLSDREWAKSKFEKILLDPARAGAAGIVDQVSELGAKRVVYVSCNPATLARDSQSLTQQGFRLTKLGMLDMFPHTGHLESIALFEK
ncbi:23S rRNA (uracil(1939)-C(5))-methyltransferase RlmD [Vibrio sp. JC009]|uniref:23S rRNA (uracil(1939)-C(5))-methyltransferase RlmD n=1 Tax=Vibrio sp. JC009 TaxID=2912314 RepID=UPI0023B08EA8|nr:23S rRNA (uracil(1939)-C(5))-methyltransferase RlmD [Vibrio sp. JC009]WED22251.1 23S rRNA (uracil(1939)-C(5))-methyltransferase RlmD [Vibrio sp. JC009]